MSRPAPEAPTAIAPDPAAGEGGSPRDHSGRLLVRMPKSLHAELARTAERDGTSLNAFIVAALSGAVGWRTPDGRAPARPAPAPPAPESERGLSVALKANLVALALAIVVAVTLLLTAWLG
jgi:hypothetical protein